MKIKLTLFISLLHIACFAGRWVEPSQAYIWEWEIADGEAVKVSRTVYDTLKYEKEQSGGRLDVPASFDGCKVVELRDIVGKFTSISIPNTVRRISGRIDGEMKRFVIPNTVTTIGDSAFRYYSQLKLVTTASGWSLDKREINEDSDFAIVLPDGLMTIESDAFASCDNLKFVRTPNSITSIGEGAFSGCSNLRDAYVAMGEGADIGRIAFSGCEQLHGVHILGGVTNIGNSAFYGCTWLSQLELPGGLLRIGENIIGETRLSDVRIPASVNDIGCLKYHAADDSCSSLRSVTFDGDAPSYFRRWVAEYEYNLANPSYPRPTESTEVYVWPWYVASYENLSFTYYTTHGSYDWSPTKIIPRTDALIKFEPMSRSVLTNENVITLEKPHQGIDLYYTINGGTPDKTSARYTGEIELPLGESTVRVVGYWGGDGKVCTSAGSWASYTVIDVPVRTITFDANGGECNVSELRRNEGSPYGTLPIPTRTGYVFDGWWTQVEGGSCIGQSCVVSSDVKIYAHWLKEITITFDANGGSCPTEHCVTTNERLFSELPKASREGFAFDGWWTSKEGGKKVDVDFIADSPEIVLYAHWVNFAKLIKDISAERSGGVVKISYRMVCALIDDGYSILRFYKDRNGVRQIRSETGDISVVEGRHEVVWNYKQDGLGDIDEDAKIVVAVMRRVDAPYCCVNLQSLNDETNGICYSDKPCEASDCLLFRYVPAGEMQIDGNKIALTRPYYLMLSPLMQHQYEIIMGNVGPGDDYVEQVVQISYNDARGAFSTVFGNAYATFPTDRVTPESLLGIFSKRTGLNCDLPTEAQWDFAYTSGLGQYGQYPWGATSNLWGFCHMEDNWEWCRDDYNWYSMGRKFGVDPLYEQRIVSEYCAKVHKKGTARKVGYSNTRASMRICILPMYDDFYDDVARSECGISIYYKVTFDAQGGDVQESEIEILNGRAIGELPVAERAGDKFLGWFTQSGGGEEVFANTIVNGEVTYYAHWKTSDSSYEWAIENSEDGTVIITGVSPMPKGCLEIPSKIGGKTVSVIGKSVFSSCRELTSLIIPDSVIDIGEYAFSGCCGLMTVEIPVSLTHIGDYAFEGCGKLTSIVIPEGVVSIGKAVFNNCSNLSDIVVSANNPEYVSLDGILYTKSVNALIACPAGKMGEVTIPTGVTCIGERAFFGCDMVTSVNIPMSVTSIGRGAFDGCSGVTSVMVPTCVSELKHTFPHAYAKIEEVILCEGTTQICDYAFSGCSELSSVQIPSSVTSVGDGAFYDCSNLLSIKIPSRVTSIGSEAFWGCSGLTAVEIPSRVTSIGSEAFWGCSGLTAVEIPSSVTSIGSYAFSHCSGLTTIEIPYGVTSVAYRLFYGCSGLVSVTIPTSVTSIEYGAFESCSSLASVILPPSVTSIGDFAFSSCRGLTSVVIPSSVVWVGTFAFWDCKALAEVYVDIDDAERVRMMMLNSGFVTDRLKFLESGADVFVVTFNANDGECLTSLKSYENGAILGTLPLATRDEYIFDGWYTEANGGIKVTATTVVTGNMTLYAHWRSSTNAVSIFNVEACPQSPQSGLVDITVMFQGASNAVAQVECVFVATNSATKVAIPVEHITRNGVDEGSGSVWTRKFIWDAKADVGTVKIDDVALMVDVKFFGGVQLWENGPYWAECNVGASKPEEYGYYFWWGDTVGCKRNTGNDGWITVKDVSVFSFSTGNCSTYGKSNSQLQSEGYVDATGNLVAAHDAATVHLGTSWRMPTDAEFSALIANCTMTWTTCNGVNGRLVSGKADFAAKSIFLPAAGFGEDNSGIFGWNGAYWSSTQSPWGLDDDAVQLVFGSSDLYMNNDRRCLGVPIRPVRGFADVSVTGVGMTTHLTIDCRDGQEDCTISFDPMGGAVDEMTRTVSKDSQIGTLPFAVRDGFEFIGWFTAVDGGIQLLPAMIITSDVTYYAHWRKVEIEEPKSVFHVDASDLSTMEIVTENGKNYVVRWDDASGGGVYAMAGSVRPTLKTVNDKQIVDFGGLRMENYGSENYGAWMRWSETDRSVREVFIVCCDNPEGNVYRQFVLTSDVSDWTYDFHRSLNLQSVQGLFDEECASDRVKNGLIQVDGTTVPYDYALPEGLHVLHIRTTGNVTANTFAKDRTCRYGGLMIAEVIVYDEPLDDETAGKVQQQLIDKWLTHVPVLSVVFETVGGSPTPSPLSKSRGEVYGELPEVQRAGYDFAGWWTASDGGVRVGSADGVQESITLYAHWRILHYKINYDLSGGINAGVNPMSYTVEDAVILADPTREGYDFVGWSPDHGVIAKGSTGDKTFAANWKQRTHVGGLVAWYKFDGNLNDESGNGYDMQGTIDGYAIGCCSIGQALSFSGGTFVSPENVIEIESSFTISGWLKSEEDIAVVSERSSGIQTNGKMVLTPGHGAVEGAGVGFAYGKNGVAIYEHGSSYLPVVLMYNAAIGTGWNFVTITVADNAAPKLYLNGKFVKQGVQGDRNYRCVKLGKNAASIGGEFYGNRFYGNVDDFRIYNRALSESEIEALCNGESDWQPVDVILPKEVSGGAEITIPAQWVTESLPRQYGEDRKMQFVKMYGSDYGTALLKKSGKVDCAGNELFVWQDYVAGTDPTDSNSLFRTFIDIVNGCPQIRWEPNLNGTDKNRIYTVFGKYELSDEQWHSPTNGRSRFFKVSVEMP